MLRLFYAVPPEDPVAYSPALFSEYRKARLASLRPMESRRQSIAAELLLIHALHSVDPDFALPPRLVTGEKGKPRLAENGLFFSLSHTEGLAVCAICDRDLGVDAERNRPYREALAQRFLHEEEQRALRSASDPADCFTLLWTLKESYLKALGCGLTRPLRSFCVLLEPKPHLANEPDVGFWHEVLNGIHVSLCVPGCSTPEPETLEEIKLL